MDLLNDYWPIIMAGFIVLEKIVKVSKTQADDILVDVLLFGLQRLLGKVTKRPTP